MRDRMDPKKKGPASKSNLRSKGVDLQKKKTSLSSKKERTIDSSLGRSSGRPVGRPLESQSSVPARDLILQAYFELCRTEGIESITLQKIADRSAVALTTVRYHFQLQGLSLSQVAMDYVADKTYEFLDVGMLMARQNPHFDPVESYIQVTIDWLEKQPLQASFLVYFYYLCSTEVPLKIENQELIQIAHRRIQGLLHEGLGMKLYRFDGDVKQMSRQVHMLVMGACMTVITSRNPDFSREQIDVCLKIVRQLLQTQSNKT